MEILHLPADKLSPSDTASGSRTQSCLPGSPEVQSLDGFLPVTFSGPEGKSGLQSHSQGSPSSLHVSKWIPPHPPQRSTAESQACDSRTSQLQGTLFMLLWELSYWCALTPESLCLTLERERGITSVSTVLWSHEPSSRYTIPVKHEKLQWRNVLGSIWPVLCKTVKIMRTRKDGETLDYGPEGMKELLWSNAVWYPGLDSGKKDISGKTGEIQ